MLCEEFNNLTNTYKREEQQCTNPYPRLTEEDERRNLTNREIVEKYIDLETSFLAQKEKEEIMDMHYRYKEAFSLRDGYAHAGQNQQLVGSKGYLLRMKGDKSDPHDILISFDS